MTPDRRAGNGGLGPERFDAYVDRALYGPGGFYTVGGGAGRRGDFITSPEVGPLFGAVLARALAGEDVVIEAGAGRGTLARAVRGAGFEGRWICVERSPVLRAEAAAAGFEVAGRLPEVAGAVVANELLDNLAFRLLERTVSGWAEVYVHDGREVLVAIEHDPAVEAEAGARVPLQEQASAWVAEARARGPVLVFDYADTTASLARRPWLEWVRTYRGHARGGHPLEAPGTQDVTCEVAVDQLPVPARDRSQADWLEAHGLAELVEEGRRVWHERAHLADLAALRGRSRVGEGEALTDATGLGAFRVLEWEAAGT